MFNCNGKPGKAFSTSFGYKSSVVRPYYPTSNHVTPASAANLSTARYITSIDLRLIDNMCIQRIASFLPGLVFGHPIAFALPSFVILVILFNVLQQLAFKIPNEPPLVFHWLPIIGSTVTYGIDPFKFFFDCQAKVRR